MKKKLRNMKNKKPEIRVNHNSYQPNKAELEMDVSIPTTPQHLAGALGRKVDVIEEIDNTEEKRKIP